MTQKYKFDDELCDKFPKFSEEEFAGLIESIKQNGQLDPCLRFGGKIFDGKHRCLAAIEAGREPVVRDWHPKSHDPKQIRAEQVAIVRAKNLDRRHLTPGQRASIAVQFITTEGKGQSERNASKEAFHQEQAAISAGVSRSTIQRMEGIAATGAPELVEAVKAGDVTISDAAKVADLPKSEQRKAVKAVKRGKARTLAAAVAPREPGEDPVEQQHKAKTAAAIRRNGKATIKAPPIDEKAVTQAFGVVARLIDAQANACGINNGKDHKGAIGALSAALDSYKSFTTECKRILTRKAS